jgi:hypothetical protein
MNEQIPAPESKADAALARWEARKQRAVDVALDVPLDGIHVGLDQEEPTTPLVPIANDGTDAIRDILVRSDLSLDDTVAKLAELIVPPERVQQALQLALRERQAMAHLLRTPTHVNLIDAVDAVVRENAALRRKMGFTVKRGGKKRRR